MNTPFSTWPRRFRAAEFALFLILFGIIGSVRASAWAIYPWLSPPTGPVTAFADWTTPSASDFGMTFTMKQTVAFNTLGAYSGLGYNGAPYFDAPYPQTVGIYRNSDGRLIRSAVINSADTLWNGYNWVPVGFFNLYYGETYTLMIFTGYGGHPADFDIPGYAGPPDFLVGNSEASFDYGYYLPNQTGLSLTGQTVFDTGSSHGYYGPNIGWATPEPGTLLLLGTGLLGLAGTIRRKLRRA